MKLIITNKHDGGGGASRAAASWHKSMISAGVDSYLLVENSTSPNPRTISPNGKIRKIYNYFKTHFDVNYLSWKYSQRDKFPWGLNILPTGMHKEINLLKPDLVNLHWISQSTIALDEISKISAPLVWTMHDMWALTGGCHYSYGCDKFLAHCGTCPQLKSRKEKDLSHRIFDKKINLVQKKRIDIIASSQWLGRCFKSSPIYKDMNIHIIPNPIDLDTFKPIKKNLARSILNLAPDKKIILFMAFSATSDTRKGAQFIPAMLEELENSYHADDLELVIVGASFDDGKIKTKFKKHFLGNVTDDWSLALLYSSCDAMISPSKEENLSLAVTESLACGTPVVAFNIGGMPDLITHKHSGYLAKPFDPIDLAHGLKFTLESHDMPDNARKYVLANYHRDVVTKAALKVFEGAIR